MPAEDRPPENVVHLSFQLMVFLGTALAALAAWTGLVRWRSGELPRSVWWRRAVVLSGPAAVLALEARCVTRYVRCAHCAQTDATSQLTKRAARAASSAALLSAAEARRPAAHPRLCRTRRGVPEIGRAHV